MPRNLQIAIDGPAGAGKTTMAKLLSNSLNITYLDTGRLYRAMAYYFKANNITDTKDMAKHTNQNIILSGDRIILNQKDITDEIYTPEIGEGASVCSTIPEVRNSLLSLQKNITKTESCIMDGRDIGTIIMPNADVKFYLTAADTTRAQRRLLEIHEKTQTPITSNDMEQMLLDIHERDKRDMTREVAPLKRAYDALLIDNTNMSIKDTFELMNRICRLTQILLA